MLLAWIWLGCAPSPSGEGAATVDTAQSAGDTDPTPTGTNDTSPPPDPTAGGTGDTVPGDSDDTGPDGTSDTGPTTWPTASTADTGGFDCGTVPSPPLVSTRITGPPASEDFAFDDLGHLVSFQGTWVVRSLYPPGAVTPWVPTQGGPGGPASIRRLPSGDFVYHDVDTGTLYRITAKGAPSVIFSGFGYAGGIEVFSDDLVYVVDLSGLQLIDPGTGSQQLLFAQAPWSSANGVSLSADHGTLFVSARDGIWAVEVDVAGQPTGQPVLWADPPKGASELLGMGVDRCDNVYVTGSANNVSTLWRYAAGGKGAPEVLLERSGGWLSNLQWGSGVGGWDPLVLYVVDRQAQNPGYDAVEVAVPEKLR